MPWAAKAGKPLYHLIRTRAYDSELIWLALTVQCVRRTIFQITETGMGSTIMAGVPTATGDSWTAVDAREFSVRSQILIEQENAYDPMDNLHVNEAFTLDENIGDLGGLTIAYRAYQLSLKGKPAPVIQGFTGPQQFFLGWAQAWRRKYRDEELRQRLVTDPHSPSQYRCIGVVSNNAGVLRGRRCEGKRQNVPPLRRSCEYSVRLGVKSFDPYLLRRIR